MFFIELGTAWLCGALSVYSKKSHSSAQIQTACAISALFLFIALCVLSTPTWWVACIHAIALVSGAMSLAAFVHHYVPYGLPVSIPIVLLVMVLGGLV